MDIIRLGIQVDTDDICNAGECLDRLRIRSGNAENSVRGLVTELAALAGVTFSIGAATDAWVKFDEATRSAANLTGMALSDIKNMALDSGIAMGKFSGDVAAAFGTVGSFTPALLSNAAALKAVTESSLILADAAAATGDALTSVEAAAAVTAALNQWGVSAENAAQKADEFSNTLAAGALAGSASIGKITEAMAGAGTVAANAGISFQEFTATVETLAEKQIAGAEAGTALRSVITSLSTKGEDFQKMGLGAVTATLNTEGLSAALKKLQPISNDTTALVKVFGEANLTAAQVLIKGADSVDKYTAAVTGTKTAHEQAEAGAATFTNKIGEVIDALKNIASMTIDIAIAPTVIPIIDMITEGLKELSEALNFLTENTDIVYFTQAFGVLFVSLAAAPAIVAGLTTAFTFYTAVVTGAIPLTAILNAEIMGIGLAAQFSAGWLGKLQIAAGTVFALFAGWEVGKWLYAEFEEARVGGILLVTALLKGWNAIAISFDAMATTVGFIWSKLISSITERLGKLAESAAYLISSLGEYIEIPGAASLAASLDGIGKSMMQTGKFTRSWGAEMDALSGKYNRAQKELDDFEQKSVIAALGSKKAAKGVGELGDELDKTNDKTDKTNKNLPDTTKNLHKFAGGLDDTARAAKQAAAEVSRMWETLAKETATLGMDEASKRAFDLREAMTKAGESPDAIQAKSKEYELQVRLNQEFEQAVKLQDEMVKAADDRNKKQLENLDNLRDEIGFLEITDEKERERAKFLSEYSKENQEIAGQLYDQKNAMIEQNAVWNDVKNAASSFFENLIETGESSFSKLWKSFKSIAVKAFMDSLASGKGIFANISGIMNAGGAGGGLMSSIAGFFGGGSGGGVLGSIGNFLGIGQLFSGGMMSGIMSGLGTIGSVISTAMPLIGAITTGISIFGSIFGGKKKVEGQGIVADIAGGDIQAKNYVDIKQKKFFRNKRWTEYSELGGSESKSLDDWMIQTKQSIADLGVMLDADFTTALDGFKASFKGKAEDFQKWLGEQSTLMLTTAIGTLDDSGFNVTLKAMVAEAGEDAKAITETVASLLILRSAFTALGNDANNLSIKMIEAGGGITSLTSGISTYFEEFYSESEKTQMSINGITKTLTEEVDKIGVALPKSKAEFRALAESIDLTTESGQEAYGKLMQVAPMYAQLADLQEQQAAAAIELFNIDAKSLAESFTDAIFNAASAEEAGKMLADQFTQTFYQGMIGSVMSSIAQAIMGGVVQPFLSSASTAAMSIQGGAAAAGYSISAGGTTSGINTAAGGITAGINIAAGGVAAAKALASIVAEAKVQIAVLKEILSDPEIKEMLSEITDSFADFGSSSYTSFQEYTQSPSQEIPQNNYDYDNSAQLMEQQAEAEARERERIARENEERQNILNKNTSEYYEAFYSENERGIMRVAEITEILNKELGTYDLAIPESKESFRALVDSIDRTTESGKSAYETLMNAAPLYAEMAEIQREQAEIQKEKDEELAEIQRKKSEEEAAKIAELQNLIQQSYDMTIAKIKEWEEAILGLFSIDVDSLAGDFTDAIFNSSSAQEAGESLAEKFTQTFYQGMIGSVMTSIAQAIMGGVVQPFLMSTGAAAMNLQSGAAAAGTALSTGGAAAGTNVAAGGSFAAQALSGIVAEARAQIAAMKEILSDPGVKKELSEIQDMFKEIGGEAYEAFTPVMQELQVIDTAAIEAAKAMEDFAKKAMETAESLDDWLKKQILGETSSLGPMQKFAEAERQATELYQQAIAGDLEAAQKLPSILDTVLDMRRDVYGSAGYAEYEKGIREKVSNLSENYGGGITPQAAPISRTDQPAIRTHPGQAAPVVNVTNSNGDIVSVLYELLGITKEGLEEETELLERISKGMGLTRARA